jgi:hypothetical protein
MASTVESRPSHYETLGLAASASAEDIARAYARAIGVFGSRPLADVAQASIAFETLRDPVRRRAYDESLGARPAQPRIASIGGRARFIGVAPDNPVEPLLHASLPQSAPPAAPAPEPESSNEPRTASFIAASLREPVEPRPPRAVPVEPEDRPQPLRRAQAETGRGVAEPTGGERMVERARELRLADADDAPVQWSRTAAIAGGLVAGVVLLGALLGLNASDGEEAQPAQSGVTAALPTPKPPPPTTAPVAAVPTARTADVQPRRVRAAVAPVRTTRNAAAPGPAAAQSQLSLAAPPPGETRLADIEIGPAVADPAPAETAAAMPLSNATIARTIERIGYSCGKVASTAPVEGGASGTYTVTCTSGHSYRAAPVHGRYRFRRLASH